MLQRSFKSLVLVVLNLLVFSAAAFPQQKQINPNEQNKKAYFLDKQYDEKKMADFLANLSVAIQAENLGLRKSAVYLAGLYSLNEVVPALVSQLEKENNSDVKILIALALYRMEDPIGMEAVEKLYKNDSNVRVKRMSKAIVDEFRNKFAQLEISER
jgi:HEAT repeat protein